VRTLVAEALRVLQPGGLLVMETPNPENLVVGAGSFYRDPSHLRPLPPELLGFATEYAGFARNKVVRLQEMQELHRDIPLGMQHVLEGVSPDYAIVAQKAAAPDVLAQFDAAFGVEYGISLGLAAHRYDVQAAQLRGRVDTATSYGDQALGQLDAVRASVATLAGQLSHTHSELGEQVLRLHADLGERLARSDAGLHQQLERSQAEIGQQLAHTQADFGQRLTDSHSELGAQVQQLAERLAVAEARGQQVDAMLASRSWQVTAPLRVVGGWARRLRAAVRNGTLAPGAKRRAKHAVRFAGQAVLRDPRTKRAARAVLARFPALQARLREMMYQAPAAPGAPPPPSQHAADLSPRAQRIYAALKQTQAEKES
jgi:O-antigen chain-terminating methyltransferase